MCTPQGDVFEDAERVKLDGSGFPTVKMTPDELNVATATLVDGVYIEKYSRTGKIEEKFFMLDKTRTKFVYTPSKKPVVNTTIYLKDIVEVRDVPKGERYPDTVVFSKFKKRTRAHPAQLFFAIVYRTAEGVRKYRSLNMRFMTEKEKDAMCNVVSFFAQRLGSYKHQDPEQLRIYELWMDADHDRDKKLSRDEVNKMLRKLNCKLGGDAVKEMFDQADVDKNGWLEFDEFNKFYRALKERPEVDKIFKALSKDGDRITAEDFCRETPVTEKEALEVVQKYGGPSHALTKEQYTTYLFSHANSWWKPDDRDPMTYPLPMYYINSSHNTYLTGHQLHGASSEDMYKIVLEKGCRCVELDCWDGHDGDPIIYHGYTYTSRIKFRSVCQTIRKYAFTTSPYPVILSLEVHTNLEQQKKMAEIMIAEFGDLLLTRKHDMQGSNFTPKNLKWKILIKGKMASEHHTRRKDEDSEDEKDEGVAEMAGKAAGGAKKPDAHGHKQHAVALELSDVITVRATKVTDWGANSTTHEIQSYSETHCMDLCESDAVNFAEMNMRMMSRVYPKGKRVDSSNYDPFTPWSVGCQAVALNFQRLDEFMRLYHAKFEANGNCGYVLKPPYLLRQGGLRDYLQARQTYMLAVTLVSAFQLPRGQRTGGGTLRPYVTVQIYGTKEDRCDPRKSPTVQCDWSRGCRWDREPQFIFHIRHTSVAMLSLGVVDSVSGDRIAEGHIPVHLLRRGYRVCPLRDHDRAELPNSYLLLNVKLSLK